jgi:hypothetical protein
MKIVDLYQNADGTWPARLYSSTLTGTLDECRNWLRANGE